MPDPFDPFDPIGPFLPIFFSSEEDPPTNPDPDPGPEPGGPNDPDPPPQPARPTLGDVLRFGFGFAVVLAAHFGLPFDEQIKTIEIVRTRYAQ